MPNSLEAPKEDRTLNICIIGVILAFGIITSVVGYNSGSYHIKSPLLHSHASQSQDIP